jgi:mRNA interferase RelE/StbE
VSWDYSVDERALKELKKLWHQARKRIVDYLDERIAGSNEDPRRFGKGLTGDLADLWRYRAGDFRLICSVQDGRFVVLVLRVGHRREIYD